MNTDSRQSKRNRYPLHLACDRCFSVKEKCRFTNGNTTSTCDRCIRLGYECIITRKKQKLGRPRKDGTGSDQPRAYGEFAWSVDDEPKEAPLPTGMLSRSESREIMVKDERGAIEESTVVNRGQTPSLELCLSPPRLNDRTPRDRFLLGMMLEERTYIRKFLISPSFEDEMLRGLRTGLLTQPDMLLNISLACSGRFSTLMGSKPSSNEITCDFERSARAVKTLRVIASNKITQGDNLITIILLGVGILTFDLMDSGAHAHSVCRFTIQLAESFYLQRSLEIQNEQALPSRSQVDFHMVPLIFFDTCNCIIRRQVPVQPLPPRASETVDRYMGLCGWLFRHLFDICQLSYQLGLSASTTSQYADAVPEIQTKLKTIELAVLSWDPSSQRTMGQTTSSHHMEAMIDQAKIYRLATLLLILRLIYPRGTEDDAAWRLSVLILTAIGQLYCKGLPIEEQEEEQTGLEGFSKQSVYPEYRLNLPFLIASVEVVDVEKRERIMEMSRTIVCDKIYPGLSEKFRFFLCYVWEATDRDCCRHWFDLVPQGPPIVLF